MIAAICFGIMLALIVIWSAANTSADAPSEPLRWAVIVGGIVAAGLCVAVVWECLVPGSPLAEGTLVGTEDRLEIGATRGGVIKLLAEPADGVTKKGQSVIVQLMVTGEDETQRERFEFRLGDKVPDAQDHAPALEQLSANVILGPIGDDAIVRLESVEPPATAVISVAFYGRRVPFRLFAIILTILAVLGAFFEAMTPASHRRSFLTVSLASAAALVWLLLDGLTGESPVKVLFGRLLWASVTGMVAGTLGPLLIRSLLPKRRRPVEDPPA